MSHPTFPIHPHPHGLMSNRNQRRLRRQQAGATASQGGPVFVSPEDQFRMSLDSRRFSELDSSFPGHISRLFCHYLVGIFEQCGNGISPTQAGVMDRIEEPLWGSGGKGWKGEPKRVSWP